MQLRSLRFALLPLFALGFLGAARQPQLSVRFHSAANVHDGSPFASAVQIGNPPRTAYIDKVPEVSEQDVVAIWPHPAEDGTMGCTLKLDVDGALRLRTVTTERRGTPLVCLVNGKVIMAVLIDRPVTDGIIDIKAGLTAKQITLLRKQYRVMGEGKKG